MNIEKLPKLDLHCHLDGSVRVETMYELLKAQGQLEGVELEDFRDQVSVRGECRSLVEYLEKFKYPGQVMQSQDNLERITYELLEDMYGENVVYAEIRFAPYLHMEEGLTFDQVVQSLIRACERARGDLGIRSNLILIAMRHEDENNSMDVASKGAKYLGRGVMGFDIAGNEADFPPRIHQRAFKYAKETGYKITIHAGETGSLANIYDAIELGADRIGHGIAARQDGLLMDKLAQLGLGLEMCPLSNMQTKAVESRDQYPIREFLDRAIKVTINTDNRTVSSSSMTEEIKFVMENYGLDQEDILRITRNSIEASFASREDKEYFLGQLLDYEKTI